jgi:thiol-disulfide isomerase/thioredoxin
VTCSLENSFVQAAWCGPCRAFTPSFASAYEKQGEDKDVEVIFVSSDSDSKSFQSYFSHHPWFALPFDADARSELPTAFSVYGIPCVAVVSLTDGHVISKNARGAIGGATTLTGLFSEEMKDEGGSWCSVQ